MPVCAFIFACDYQVTEKVVTEQRERPSYAPYVPDPEIKERLDREHKEYLQNLLAPSKLQNKYRTDLVARRSELEGMLQEVAQAASDIKQKEEIITAAKEAQSKNFFNPNINSELINKLSFEIEEIMKHLTDRQRHIWAKKASIEYRIGVIDNKLKETSIETWFYDQNMKKFDFEKFDQENES